MIFKPSRPFFALALTLLYAREAIMFCLAALTALAFALPSAAAPAHGHVGIRIPLHKRSSLTTTNGTFNHTAAIVQSVKIAK